MVTKDGVQLEANRPENRARHAYGFEYRAGLAPEAFLGLLHRYWGHTDDYRARVSAYQEFEGAARVGLATKGEKAFVLLGEGEGNHGKSTLMTTLADTMPPDSTCALQPHDFGKFKLEQLRNKLINIVDDLRNEHIRTTDAIKTAITGSGYLTAEEKNKPAFTFVPKAGHIWGSQFVPTSSDWTGGYDRRFLFLIFDKKLSDNEVDKFIATKCKAEVQARVCWALDGAVRFMARGCKYTEVPSSDERIAQWRLVDPVAAFVAEECAQLDPEVPLSGWAKREDLYEVFAPWSEARGHKRMSLDKFSERLVKYRKHTEKGSRYRLRLTHVKAPDTPEKQAEYKTMVNAAMAPSLRTATVIGVTFEGSKPTLDVVIDSAVYPWRCSLGGLSNLGLEVSPDIEDGHYMTGEISVQIEFDGEEIQRLFRPQLH